jgi:DNA-binding MarR family transcriptional regulator
VNVLRTSHQHQVRFARLFRPYGLSPSQYNILRILRGEGKPLPILEIASRTISVVPGITDLIARLEECGFVKRDRCREDRRVIRVTLWDKARSPFAAIDEPLEDLHRRLFGHLTQAELKRLIRLLAKARAGLADEG